MFSVDLNPIAVQLAEVSLWLNSIYEGAFVPWFGMQLVCGNSLVGARRQVYSKELLSQAKKGAKLWYESEPLRIQPGESRNMEYVYHFLLPDPGMSKYDDKVVKDLAKEYIQKVDGWRSKFALPLEPAEVSRVLILSEQVDILWRAHAEKLRALRETTTDPQSVFGQEDYSEAEITSTEQKDALVRQEGLMAEVVSSSTYSVLKFVMDYWCALWFWPILQSDNLPTRTEYFCRLGTDSCGCRHR